MRKPDGGAPAGAWEDERIVKDLMYCASFLRNHTEGKGSQRRVLSLLRARGPLTQQEILEEMGVRPGSLSELLHKLEARGYIQKEKSAADKRNYNVSLTPDGAAALEEMQAQYGAAMSDLLSGLTGEEREQLAALLEKLRGLWRARADESAPHHGHGHPHEHGHKGPPPWSVGHGRDSGAQ